MIYPLSMDHAQKTALLLSRDVTAYAEMCVPSLCIGMDYITHRSMVACMYYVAAAVSVAHQFLHAASTPQYL
jgi:hypothetical protein